MSKIRVLLADDIALLREDLSELIDGQPDMEIVGAAASGEEILALARATEFDILLMDIEMEDMNAGIRASELILDEKSANIIFLTAHETETVILSSMAVGAVDYVVKGCPEEVLLEHIRRAYSGSPMLDAKIQNLVLREYSRLRQSEESLLFFIHNISRLTAAERELVKLLLMDKKVKEIAEIRCVEIVTVKTQIKSLLRKFGCSRSKEIVKIIQELGITHLF